MPNNSSYKREQIFNVQKWHPDYAQAEKMRENLSLNLSEDKIVLCWKITRALKDIYENNKDVVNKDTLDRVLSTNNLEIDRVDWESIPNPEGQIEVLPASDRETYTGGGAE